MNEAFTRWLRRCEEIARSFERIRHAADCASNNMPAAPAKPCDCGAADAAFDLAEIARRQ